MDSLTADQIAPPIRGALAALGWREAEPPTPAGSAASGRSYWRFQTADGARVLQINPLRDEVIRFIDATRAFAKAGLPVARIHAESDTQLLLDDLGRTQLYDRIQDEGAETPALAAAVELICQIQAAADVVTAALPWLAHRQFDHEHLLWETAYFRDHCWIPRCKPDAAQCDQFEIDRHALAKRMLQHPQTLVHRDFQSQNVLFPTPDAPALVDYQGCRIGSIFYDLASLLFDPYLELPESRVRSLFAHFCDRHPQISDCGATWPQFLDAALQRIMQANGAYGFLTNKKGLETYRQWQAPGLRQLNLVRSLYVEHAPDSPHICM